MLPDRLDAAKLAIDDFAVQLDGDAVGIVAFAGRASWSARSLSTTTHIHETLSAIDTNTMPRGAPTLIGHSARPDAALEHRPGRDKVLILVTDGEDLEGDSLAAARTAARQDGLEIYTVGVGTLRRRAHSRAAGRGRIRQGRRRRLGKISPDEPALKAIAAATGGIYAPLGAQGEGLGAIFKAVFGLRGKARPRQFRQKKSLHRALSMAARRFLCAAARQSFHRFATAEQGAA